ncbi:inactive protein RESTRICTED TEV MOVEMENT 2 [Rhodamnia argentea]|uniref:Inactive protein RESTRICTED TEV MOVEMENT 2 n=1 Tax=Rhodamnia argentea TaxID=178133 RepID=A0A8B8NJY8_9MYRT|nr:inactive protein RESTRICTED TEV MOVEMENT 2 [Rhodamnia argentea]
MDARTAAREYEDIDPTTNWEREDRLDTLIIYLPGFKREQLKVQITSEGNLRVMGERQVTGNKWSRFRKEMPIASNYDSNKISAKFDNGILRVKLQKIIIPAEPRGEAKPAVQPTKPPEPTPAAEPQKRGPKQDTKEPPKAEQVPAKPTEEDKKPKISTEDEEKPKEVKEESKRADEAKNGREMALQQKSDDLAEKKATEKDQKRGDTADIGKKMEKTGTKKAGDVGEPKAKTYKENVGNLVTKLKKPRNLMNTMVAALLIVVLGLYVKHAFRSIGTTESDPEL